MYKNAIIMLNWNGSDDTIFAIQSLIETNCIADFFIVDNGSKKEEVEKLMQIKSEYGFESVSLNSFTSAYIEDNNNQHRFFVLSNINLGFAGANNLVASIIAPFFETVTLLNNDIEAEACFIDDMYKTLLAKKLTAITCDIRYFYDKTLLWNDGGNFTWYGDRKYYAQKKIDKLIEKGIDFISAEFITGCCLMIASDYIIHNGLFTDKFFHGEEDFNLCKRFQREGLKVGVTLKARIYHKVGQALNFDKNDIKTLNKTIVHYTNRIINMREFYGKKRWKMWRIMYIFMTTTKNLISTKNAKYAIYIAKNVVKFSKKFDNVRSENYQTIMENRVEI